MNELACKKCGCVLFEKVEVGQYRFKQDWLDRGLPLPKTHQDEWSSGGGMVYRCFKCGELANQPRTEFKKRNSNMATL